MIRVDGVDRFCLVPKSDAVLIVASYAGVEKPVTIAKYEDRDEADRALTALYNAITADTFGFQMPDSRLWSLETEIKDARTKRKGGS